MKWDELPEDNMDVQLCLMDGSDPVNEYEELNEKLMDIWNYINEKPNLQALKVTMDKRGLGKEILDKRESLKKELGSWGEPTSQGSKPKPK